MDSARDARAKLLEHADELIETYVKVALGKQYKYEGDPAALQDLVRMITPAMKLEDDPVKIRSAVNNKSGMVDDILRQMKTGRISILQAQATIKAIRTAQDMEELDRLLTAIEEQDPRTLR